MNRRLVLALLLATLAQYGWAGSNAYADDDKDSEKDSDDSGDDSNDSSDGVSDDSSDDSSDDGGSDDGSDGSDDSGGSDSGGNGSNGGTSTGDHERARTAVETAAAIPLKKLLELFRRDFEGKLVDVTLVKRKTALIYRIKFIDGTGRVRRVEYDAVTGSRLN